MAKELIPLRTNAHTVNSGNPHYNGQEYRNRLLPRKQYGDPFFADISYWILLEEESQTGLRTALASRDDPIYNAKSNWGPGQIAIHKTTV